MTTISVNKLVTILEGFYRRHPVAPAAFAAAGMNAVVFAGTMVAAPGLVSVGIAALTLGVGVLSMPRLREFEEIGSNPVLLPREEWPALAYQVHQDLDYASGAYEVSHFPDDVWTCDPDVIVTSLNPLFPKAIMRPSASGRNGGPTVWAYETLLAWISGERRPKEWRVIFCLNVSHSMRPDPAWYQAKEFVSVLSQMFYRGTQQGKDVSLRNVRISVITEKEEGASSLHLHSFRTTRESWDEVISLDGMVSGRCSNLLRIVDPTLRRYCDTMMDYYFHAGLKMSVDEFRTHLEGDDLFAALNAYPEQSASFLLPRPPDGDYDQVSRAESEDLPLVYDEKEHLAAEEDNDENFSFDDIRIRFPLPSVLDAMRKQS